MDTINKNNPRKCATLGLPNSSVISGIWLKGFSRRGQRGG
jgi:hypothetical protein